MRVSSSIVARRRVARTIARAGALLSTVIGAGVACSNRVTDEPGIGPTIDRPVAVLSASKNDVTTIELYFVSENGGTSIKVPTFPGPKWQVRWSGDGRRLAIAGNTLGAGDDLVASASDIWVMDADGTGLMQITRDGISGSPSWLADGRLVYVSAPAVGAAQWYAVPASGGAPVPITLRNGQPVYEPDWSRTSPQMSFNDDTTVFTAAVDGTGERGIAGGTLPRWSPKGDRIAYLGRLNGGPKLFVISPGAQSRPTIAAPDLSQFAGGFTWSPDGRLVVWIRNTAAGAEAVTSPADGSGAPAVLVQRGQNITAYDVDVDWRPTPAPTAATAPR